MSNATSRPQASNAYVAKPADFGVLMMIGPVGPPRRQMTHVMLATNLDVRYWMQALHVSREQLESAVAAVGTRVEDVMAFLQLPERRMHSMDIAAACETIRAHRDLLDPAASRRGRPRSVPAAVLVLKTYLENAKGDGESLTDLVLPDSVWTTPAGVNWLMPFVLSAESMEASRRGTSVDEGSETPGHS